jgi:hypothetical protein
MTGPNSKAQQKAVEKQSIRLQKLNNSKNQAI